MGKFHLGKLAWLCIFVYEIICPKGQMLCEILDPPIKRWPLLMRIVIIYTALHAANLIPLKYDLFNQVTAKRYR